MVIRIIIVALSVVAAGKLTQAGTTYGLATGEGDYPYSYFQTDAQLLVGNYDDFVLQFKTDTYLRFEREHDSATAGHAGSAQVLHLPVIQTVVPGDKVVLIFERMEKNTRILPYDTVLVFEHLALELNHLACSLSCPGDFEGTLIIDDGSQWPPRFLAIDSGSVYVRKHAPYAGSLYGSLSVRATDSTIWQGEMVARHRRIAGEFWIKDRERTVFLSFPAREGYKK